MKCLYCGNDIPMGYTNCSFCGSPVQNMYTQNEMNQPQMNNPIGNQSFNQSYNEGIPYPANMPGMINIPSKKEFLQLPQCVNLKKNLKSSAIIGYICCGISLILNVGVLQNYAGLIDVIIVLILTLGFHLKYEKGCAIGLLAYSIINFIYMTVATGKPGGWLIVVVGIYALLVTINLDKAWKEYQRTGMLPNDIIKMNSF